MARPRTQQPRAGVPHKALPCGFCEFPIPKTDETRRAALANCPTSDVAVAPFRTPDHFTLRFPRFSLSPSPFFLPLFAPFPGTCPQNVTNDEAAAPPETR